VNPEEICLSEVFDRRDLGTEAVFVAILDGFDVPTV
jgi:hypothetical protein